MPPQTIRVTFLPVEKTFEVNRGRTLLDVAKEKKLPVHYECDSLSTCGTCHVIVEKGGEHLTPAEEPELFHLKRQKLSSNRRLSCQARVLGDVTVRIPEKK